MNARSLVSRADLESQGRQIVEQLGGKWSARGGMCRCPAHADGSPSLSVRVGTATLLFHCFAGCDTIDVLRALRSGIIIDGSIRSSEAESPMDRRDLQPVAEKLWTTSQSLSGSLAERYLASRGLVSHSAQLRFHGNVQLGPRADATYHPALVAAVRDDVGLVAVHRTFLDATTGGRATMSNPKRLLAEPGTGAVRLGTATRVLGLAEGIETALAASRIHNIAVWAVLGNERFGMVSIPSHVERLVILADNDAGGSRAAALAQSGHARDGLTVDVVWPPAEHNDWADVLVARKSRGEGAALN